MKKIKLSTYITHLSIFFISAIFTLGYSAELTTAIPPATNCEINNAPPYLPDQVRRVQEYYKLQYVQDVEIQVQRAIDILSAALDQHQNQKNLALVSDIDDTVLSTEPTLNTVHYGFYFPQFNEALQKANFPEIKPMHKLMDFASAHGITIFYVTGRTPAMQQATEKNLKEQGFGNFKQVFYKPENYKEPSVVPYKSGAREQIESEGFVILLSIGDQASDLGGGHAEQGVKLPNYMYYIP